MGLLKPIIVVVLLVVTGGGFLAVRATIPATQGPAQPIAFSHVPHVQNAKIECEFCHRNVRKGAAATVPAVEQCMACHKVVKGPAGGAENLEIQKLRATWENQDVINWVRVHRLPDHVHFPHEPHVRRLEPHFGSLQGVCIECHSDVGNMARVRQVRILNMGDCIFCHRNPPDGKGAAPTDCVVCHY